MSLDELAENLMVFSFLFVLINFELGIILFCLSLLVFIWSK